jgi:hypothetical protein
MSAFPFGNEERGERMVKQAEEEAGQLEGFMWHSRSIEAAWSVLHRHHDPRIARLQTEIQTVNQANQLIL